MASFCPLLALDNPVFAALSGPQAHLGEVRGRARRFQPEISPFAGLPADAAPADWADLAALCGPGATVLSAGMPAPPAGWPAPRELPGVQLVAADDAAPPSALPSAPPVGDVVRLGAADVPEMADLVARTEPGPFGPRTIEFGGFLGVRVAGELVAMAGQRLRVPGYTEVSAVCTAPAFRGRGLGGWLTSAVAAEIRARGDVPFLHAVASNTGAIRLYETLGFRLRRELLFVLQDVPVQGRS